MAEEKPPIAGARSAADLRALADALRARVDLFGKSLAGLATVGTGAVGLAKISDIFPLYDDDSVMWAWIAVLSLVVAAVSVVVVAVQLMKVGEPEVVDADRVAEYPKDVARIFEGSARRFGYATLAGLEAREQMLREVALAAQDDDERKRRTALADDARAEIELALARAQVVIVRRKATDAVTGPASWFCYCAVIVGLVLFALGTDKVVSVRDEAVKIAKACAEARDAGAIAGDLADSACEVAEKKAEEKPAPPTAAEVKASLLSKLAALNVECAAAVQADKPDKERPLAAADCAAIAEAISRLTR